MSRQARADLAVAFLTAPPPLAERILRDARARLPGLAWTVLCRSTEQPALGDAAAGCALRSDKPTAGKLSFLAELRRQTFGTAVVAWAGHRSYDRVKVAALLSGAQRVLVYNENLDCFWLDARDPVWLRHLRWRLSLGRGVSPLLHAALHSYRWTLGLWVAALLLLPELGLRLLLRGLRRRMS